MVSITSKQSLVNVLGVGYFHIKTKDGGDLYLTRFAKSYKKHLKIANWYEKSWFKENRERLQGTSSVYRVPTKAVKGTSIDLVVKNCRVGEDVPFNTHTLKEFCDAEFNSPWEEFALVMEMREGKYRKELGNLTTQRPLGIYIPPEKMQAWQSGRSRSRINRIHARHPGIDLDILKQYKLIYEWIYGLNLIEIFEHIEMETPEMVHHLKTLTNRALSDMDNKGYLMADMKPEHVIIAQEDVQRIQEAGDGTPEAARQQVTMLYRMVREGNYSLIDYELVFRNPAHEDAVKSQRRHSYLDDQRRRLKPTELPEHLACSEILDVPYVYGHAESTGGHLWVVGQNARLFDYFLPERWRKTPALSLSETNEVMYTVSKDNVHLVWRTSRVGEVPLREGDPRANEKIVERGINSPFEESALAHSLNSVGIRTVYVRAIYMTGGTKVEPSVDLRKYESHRHLLDAEGNPILQKNHNYISIRGYYNGPDEWVSEHDGDLYTPVDLEKALEKGLITPEQSQGMMNGLIDRLAQAGYDGSLLMPNDVLLAVDDKGRINNNSNGQPDLIICNMEMIWNIEEGSKMDINP